MTRRLFPLVDVLVGTPSSGPRLGAAALVPHGLVVELFADAACTVPLDATDLDGSPISSVTVDGVTIPPFYGPDDDTVARVYGRPAGATGVGFAMTPADASEAAIALVDAVAPERVQAAIYVDRTTKNLFDPDDSDVLVDKFPSTPAGTYATLVGYRVSGFIPVTPGESITVSLFRGWEWWDANRTVLGPYENTGSNAAVQTLTPPAGAAYLRVANHYATQPELQVERGSTATAYEPYFAGVVRDVDLEFAAAVGDAIGRDGSIPVTVERVGESATLTTVVGGAELVQSLTLNGSKAGGVDFVGVEHDGVTISTQGDEATPIRLGGGMGTVGANHGYTVVRTFANPDGKTVADVGSTWSDGAREYVLLAIDAGRLVVGGSYTVDGSGVATSANVAPSAPLTHVTGATRTASIDHTTAAATQLYPSTARVASSLWVDGKEVTSDGTVAGDAVEVRETYDVLDYRSIYDRAKANVGTPYSDLDVDGLVRVTNRYRFTAGGRVLVSTTLLELKPTGLGSCGGVQSAAATKGYGRRRYVPGVGVVGGFDWSAGVDVNAYATTTYIATTDAIGGVPAFVVDVLDGADGNPSIGFAIGYLPRGVRGDEASRGEARATKAAARLFDLRSTKKLYPNVTLAESPGWGRLSIEAFRSYLSPAQVATVLESRGRADTGFEALDAALGLTHGRG